MDSGLNTLARTHAMPTVVIVIQVTALAGVHAQELPVVTPILLLSPVDGAETLVGDTL